MFNKVVTAAEAVKKIPDEAFVVLNGVGGSGAPVEVIDAIIDRFHKEGRPKNLSLIHSGGNGGAQTMGSVEGLLSTYYGGFAGLSPEIMDGDRIPSYSLTQGICAQLYRAQAVDAPYLTKVGLHTYLDPRQQGCAINDKAKEKSIVELLEIGGEEYLHFMLPPITVALLRATSADSDGNLVNDEEAIKSELLPMAMAAHNNGGIVIAQVKNLVEFGQINAADVKVPGMLVDYVVVCSDPEKYHPQGMGMTFQIGATGHKRVDIHSIPIESWAPQNERLVMARRGALELWPGCVSNVGIGVPVGVAYVAATEGLQDMFYSTNELGAVGGVTGGGFFFGGAFNAHAYMNHHTMFDFINGHGLNITFLGAAEIDENGSVNVTRIAGRTNGSGGFVNISSSTHKVVFMSTLTAGAKMTLENGALKILKEGKPLKLVKEVEQTAFNGKQAVKKDQEVLYITERAVFKLMNGKVTLIEYAEGLDMEKDIIANMGFRPDIAPDAKPMPAFCFTADKIGLKEQWERSLSS
jgi:propionate CoA-transferase